MACRSHCFAGLLFFLMDVCFNLDFLNFKPFFVCCFAMCVRVCVCVCACVCDYHMFIIFLHLASFFTTTGFVLGNNVYKLYQLCIVFLSRKELAFSDTGLANTLKRSK